MQQPGVAEQAAQPPLQAGDRDQVLRRPRVLVRRRGEARQRRPATGRPARSPAAAVRSGEHSTRTMPAHGAPPATGSRRYQDQPPQPCRAGRPACAGPAAAPVTTGDQRGRQVLLSLRLDVAERARQLPPAAQRAVHHQQVAPSAARPRRTPRSPARSAGACTAAGSFSGSSGAADPVRPRTAPSRPPGPRAPGAAVNRPAADPAPRQLGHAAAQVAADHPGGVRGGQRRVRRAVVLAGPERARRCGARRRRAAPRRAPAPPAAASSGAHASRPAAPRRRRPAALLGAAGPSAPPPSNDAPYDGIPGVDECQRAVTARPVSTRARPGVLGAPRSGPGPARPAPARG